jgi:hypothetical protein
MTTFEAKQDVFKARFYRWALAQILEDMNNGFPLLHIVGDSLAARFLTYAADLPENRKVLLSRGLVKRFHPLGAALNEDGISAEELLEVRLFDHTEVSTREKSRRNRAKLRRLLFESIPKLIPQSDIHWFRNICQLQVPLGGWTIRTDIDLGGSYCFLTYRQSLLLSEQLVLAENISILNWCGISGQTEWNLPAEPEEIVFGFKLVLMRFMDAVPLLIKE